MVHAVLRWSRPFALVLALLAAAGAGATPADATDDAFGALLAMPGAQPKPNGWIIPQEPAADETDLIARWQRLKKAGADFNAMRHGGTLLAHAIRAGKDRAALWLLRNGADPRKVLAKGDPDAGTLARQYQRTAVVKVLEGQYGLKPAVAEPAAPKPVAPPPPPPPPLTRAHQSVETLQRLAGAVSQPDAEARLAWRRYAATLGEGEYRALFESPDHVALLVALTRETEGGLEEALARLPLEQVRRDAPVIAGRLAEWSFFGHSDEKKVDYSATARSWPALWRRLAQPLHYDAWPDLAGRIPPDLWPGLFASGYAVHDAEATGCLLAAADPPALQALWPEFQRDFVDAREEAAGLVLGAYRIGRERSPCDYASSPADTTAKLAFLRAQGVTAPAWGLLEASPDSPRDPALAEMIAAFSPSEPATPQLVAVAPDCTLSPDDRWWTALVKLRSVGWGVPANSVQAIAIPGVSACGLLVAGDSYENDSRVSDDFADGPFRDPPPPRCADLPDDAEIWFLDGAAIRHVEPGIAVTRGTGVPFREVRDVQTGKHYLLDAGLSGASCTAFHGLPNAFEWQVDAGGPGLLPSRDGLHLASLLRRQCRVQDDPSQLACPGLAPADAAPGDAPFAVLRRGRTVTLPDFIDALGADRRVAYRAALAAHDHARLRRLLADGIPAWWTAVEIVDLGGTDLPLDEKRRRIALLFADPDQLSHALALYEYDYAKFLAPWLPRQDWKPVLRLIESNPSTWSGLAFQLHAAVEGQRELGCDIDHARGFVCGGGLNPD